MKKDNELIYVIELNNDILSVTLKKTTFWNDRIHLFETYEESYIYTNIFTSCYFQSFGNMSNTKKHVIFDYCSQGC